MKVPRRRFALLLMLALLVGTTGVVGCVSSSRPPAEACAAPVISISLEATATQLTPNDPAVCRGQRVIFEVRPSYDGVFHLHGVEVATEVEAGTAVRLEFVADQSGQFVIEAHPRDGPAAAIGVLTVHEP